MSDSRPAAVEIERRKLLEEMRATVGDTYEFRLKTAETLADIRAELKYGALWMESHQHSDTAQFKELRDKVVGVRSGINDFEALRNQFSGGWKALTGLVVLGAAIYGLIEAIAWFIEKLRP